MGLCSKLCEGAMPNIKVRNSPIKIFNNVLNSAYCEDVRVMLARLDSLLVLEDAKKGAAEEVIRLAAAIMRRLAGVAQRVSLILSHLVCHVHI